MLPTLHAFMMRPPLLSEIVLRYGRYAHNASPTSGREYVVFPAAFAVSGNGLGLKQSCLQANSLETTSLVSNFDAFHMPRQ